MLTAATALGGPRGWAHAGHAARPLFTQQGIAAPLERGEEMHAAGADYLVPRAADVLRPDLSDADFEIWRERITAAGIPVLCSNFFLARPHLRCTGPDANHDEVLRYATLLFRRLRLIGGRYVCFGSSGSRRLPDGWPKVEADAQFARLLAHMGPLAADSGIIVALEQLRSAECNYLNHLDEVTTMVEQVDHPSIRVLADFYHMRHMGDPPEALVRCGGLLALIEIAEKEGRKYPGVAGDDFRPYFSALQAAGYSGPITIEGEGEVHQLPAAFACITDQAAGPSG